MNIVKNLSKHEDGIDKLDWDPFYTNQQRHINFQKRSEAK